MSELKPCPFCGGNNLTIERLMYVVFCNDCGAEMSGNAPLGNWNTRPIEDALNARTEKAESIIRGMFPLWIAAMSYAEHGRAADLDRVRNYYNGRDNPLTSEELHTLFSMKNGEK